MEDPGNFSVALMGADYESYIHGRSFQARLNTEHLWDRYITSSGLRSAHGAYHTFNYAYGEEKRLFVTQLLINQI
jgi:hypothetical protein